MKCPFCDLKDTQVKDSRPSEDNILIRRRRYCPSCGGKFKTVERVEAKDLKVIKRDGKKRDFDPQKLANSISVAARKRNVSQNDVETIVNSIIKKLEQFGEGEIETKMLGEMVMQRLAAVDPVAYIRYSSVYKDFSSPKDFAKFIENLSKTNDNNEEQKK